MTPQEMLDRASLVFIGVIEKHQLEVHPYLHVTTPEQDPTAAKYWKIMRRQVRVETVLRGS